ncbi:TonB-dependent receptor [Dysgonomonas sp. OttesenSCG-928-M03]|nr:TonB-dependent receptor [Dysgonomonas sp. OttesenSCG-928-M03]
MKNFLICTLIISISLLAYKVKADDTVIDKDSIKLSYTADEVVIQAFKSNNNLSQLPISATLLSEQVIKERNISNVKEISGFIPNLYIPDYGSKMTSPAYIRGIGSRINAPSIGLYVDGVPYFDRSSFDINIEDIDRIEVLRGPQGTIYGRNTMGGIINIYTKSPFKYKETNIGLSAANYDTYHANASHYGSINNVLGYAISGNYLHTGGYIDNKYTGKKANPMDALSGRIRLSWRPASNLYLHLTSAYEYSDQDGYAYAPYNDTTNVVSDVDYNARSYFRRNMSTTGLNIQYSTDKIRFNSQSSFQYFDGKQGLDQDFTQANQYYVDFGQRQRMYSQEFNLKSNQAGNYDWLLGAFGFYQDYITNNNIEYIEVYPPLVPKHILQDINTPSKGIALFHQSTFNNILTKGLSAIIGLRYDWEEIRAHTILSEIDQKGVHTTNKDQRYKDTYSQFTPKFSLQYTFTNDEIVYASITKGYKAGGFNSTSKLEEALTYKPEHSWSYEIGTKANCLNKLIYTELSLFYIRWNDQQVSQNQPDGKGYILRNAGKSISKGVEATVHVNPLENLSFNLSYGYTHAKFKDYVYNTDETKKIDYSGKYLPMVPRHTFSAAANYSIPMQDKSLLDKIVLNAQYTGQGKLYWREDNIAEQPFYGTLNARTSFIKGNVSLDLWAKNITDTDYIAYYFKSSGSFAQKGKPFTCGLNLNLKF